MTHCQPRPFEFSLSGKRTLNDTTNYYLGSSSPWRLTPERARVLPLGRALSRSAGELTPQHRSYNHYYQGIYSGSEIQIKSRVPDVTWKRITIAESVSSSTWFRELYVPSSSCICCPRFDHTRTTVYARDSNKEEKVANGRRTGLASSRGDERGAPLRAIFYLC